MQSETVAIDGHGFHCPTAGDPGAPMLLFLHGFPEFSGAWRGVMARLSDRFFCVAPDQRGYGQSWRPAEVDAYAAAHLVRDMAAIIAHFGGHARAVVAHDWGAAVGYALAMRRPDLMDRLVVLNGVHPVPFQVAVAAGGAQSEASQYIDWLRRPGSEAVLAADGYAKLMTLFGDGMDLSWLTPELRREYEAAWGGELGLRGMVNWYRASLLQVAVPGEPIPPEMLPQMDPARLRIPVPHLLIWGMQDTALLPEARAGVDRFCDDLEVVEVGDADHWIIHQQPGLVAHHITRFAM